MKKISGIKSVDFIVTAEGEGVVNHNGAFAVYNPAAGQRVDNHLFPKLRGIDPLQRVSRTGPEGEMSLSIRLDDEAFSKAKLIVSSACVRAGLFRADSFGLREVTVENVDRVLASLHGLVRGYLITKGDRNMARKSPLYVTDFECASPGLVFSQGSNARTRGTAQESTSIFSYFSTARDLRYTGRASLSIEDLQFIPLEDSLGRSARDYQLTVAEGERVAEGITEYLRSIADEGLEPEARFVKEVRRIGAALDYEGDAGVLLDNDALAVIAAEVRMRIEDLLIRQGKGHFAVNEVVVDYNGSTDVFRAERQEGIARDTPDEPFACYYEEVEVDDDTFAARQQRLAEERSTREGAKNKKAAKKRSAKGASGAN